MYQTVRSFACAALLGLTACAGGPSSSTPLPGGPTPSPVYPPVPLKHIVIIVQENRSFDNLFAGYPGADAPTYGYLHTGAKVALKQIEFWPPARLNHLWKAGIQDWAGGAMNGFDLPGVGQPLPPLYMYAYLQHAQVKPYWDMANQYVLADHMFPTEFGPSYTAHQNLIAGSTEIQKGEAVINLPTLDGEVQRGDCLAPKGTTTDLVNTQRQVLRNAGPPPCFTYPSMADSMDAANVSWKYYSGFWPTGGSTWDAFGAIKKVFYGPDWDRNVTKKPFQILDDAPKGALPAISWVIPTPKDSDHPGVGSDTGPSWVAAVVNAIGQGPDWNTTAIIVVWDDWGGWYDDAKPPQLDYRGLGIRVGCLIVSPYAKKHYVTHTPYEFGSILKTLEMVFKLPSIGTTDVRATDMLDAFDFSQKPRAFVKIQSKYPPSHFKHEGASKLLIPDPGDD